jgi:hypothetical protein
VLALVHRRTRQILAVAGYHSWSPDGLPYPDFPSDLPDAAARRAARFVKVTTGQATTGQATTGQGAAGSQKVKGKVPSIAPGDGTTLDLVRD